LLEPIWLNLFLTSFEHLRKEINEKVVGNTFFRPTHQSLPRIIRHRFTVREKILF